MILTNTYIYYSTGTSKRLEFQFLTVLQAICLVYRRIPLTFLGMQQHVIVQMAPKRKLMCNYMTAHRNCKYKHNIQENPTISNNENNFIQIPEIEKL
jgi:hypothetical protein